VERELVLPGRSVPDDVATAARAVHNVRSSDVDGRAETWQTAVRQ